jgi:hypothetical protein|tara:strand:+ start:137 stop:373 length:237 start_codon:yes stop_codon:yes gene_type:complete
MSNKQFYKHIKGPMNNNEDWYSYSNDDGEFTITHEWCHVPPKGVSNNGTKTYTPDEFQNSTDVRSEAKAALKKALQEE